MLRAMYSLSFCAALGLTLNCSTMSGHPAPTTNEDSSSNASPMAGIRRSFNTKAENTATAQITAMASRMSLAGSTALMSV